MNNIIDYMKIHLISLKQDKELIEQSSLGEDSIDWHYVVGAIGAIEHLLEVANDNV
jgi:hypothetical protein